MAVVTGENGSDPELIFAGGLTCHARLNPEHPAPSCIAESPCRYGAGPSVGVIPRGFGWDGGTGTTWRSDPRTGLTGILFTQRSMTSPEPPQAFTDFWHAAFGCLDG